MASKPWTMPEVNKAIALYRDEYSAAEIGGMLGRSKDGVLHVLRANNIPIRPRGAPSVESGNECLSFRKMVEEAHIGSMRLLAAIQLAGLRP